MTPGDNLALRLEVERESDPIHGLLTAPDGQPQEFTGWLGLASAIERVLAERVAPDALALTIRR